MLFEEEPQSDAKCPINTGQILNIYNLLHLGCVGQGFSYRWVQAELFHQKSRNCILPRFGFGRALQSFNSPQRNTESCSSNKSHTNPSASLQPVHSFVRVARALQQQIWVTHPTKDKRLRMTRASVLSAAEKETKISFRLLPELKITQGEKN